MSDLTPADDDLDPEHHPDQFPWKEPLVILAAMVISAIITVTVAVRIVSNTDLVQRKKIEANPHTQPAAPLKSVPTLAKPKSQEGDDDLAIGAGDTPADSAESTAEESQLTGEEQMP